MIFKKITTARKSFSPWRAAQFSTESLQTVSALLESRTEQFNAGEEIHRFILAFGAQRLVDLSGSYAITNAIPPGVPQQFDRVSLP